MHKRFQQLLIFAFLFGVLTAGLFGIRPAAAQAAYQQIPESGSPARKIGDYYFWTEQGHIRFSKSLDGSYRSPMYATPDSLAFTNGSDILFLAGLESGQWLIRYSINNKNGSGMVQMPGTKSADDTDYSLRAIIGNYAVINYRDYDNFTSSVYTCSLSAKKMKLRIPDGHVIASSGSALVVEHGLRSDVSPFKASLYKCSSGKLKKVKSLGNYCFGGVIRGKYVYYTVSPSGAAKSATVYRIKVNGSGRKKLGKISKAIDYAFNFTSKSCDISRGGKTYRFTYKTKKLKKISSPG